ncbi:MAG: hypothetical protein Q7K39_00040 [Candidatus Magasanikbacteria bacterium]|nr:hypothetical protein [Candidatus Magasanikbacteria bacterium]
MTDNTAENDKKDGGDDDSKANGSAAEDLETGAKMGAADADEAEEKNSSN